MVFMQHLVGRKLPANMGRAIQAFFAMVDAAVTGLLKTLS